ncbi:MAG: hypothetical protein KA134_05145, partial [Achromobacter sp.]|nr:hypothetical protein [Achromobacter sp.]
EEKKSKIGSGQATLLGLGLTGKYETSETSKFYDAPTDVHSAFTGAVTRYRNASQPRSGLVIIIDEFDRIHNRKGIASLLKSLGPIGVKFVFVGVASTISELVKDHESVARQLTDGSIAVPPMSDNEADAIFDNAQEYLDHKYSWPMATRDWIRKVARGHPFYIHLLGKHSLLEAIREKSTEVSVILAQHALERIANNESAPVQEEAYKKAIRHSYPRELILKQFANEEQSEIYTSHVYPKISEIAPNLDTSKISVYVGQLTLKEYGAPLVKLRDRYYRFSDSLFKAYAAARPSQRKPAERDPDETED